MIFILSPAKALDFESPLPPCPSTSEADYLADASILVKQLRAFSPDGLARLMKVSDKIAALNAARFEHWSLPFTLDNARAAVLAFNGDVYDGLDARTLEAEALQWAQTHVRILSGLYGILRPLDLIQAYRLEMGTRLQNPRGKDLYAFWGACQTNALNTLLAAEGSDAVLVNLASQEYFKVIDRNALIAPVVTPVFEDWKDGRYKIISFYAKRARGLMCRYAIEQRLRSVTELCAFEQAGYSFDEAASGGERLVFRRRQY